jgi:MFS family permease
MLRERSEPPIRMLLHVGRFFTASIREAMKPSRSSSARAWLNRTVVGIAVASLFSDWSHEIATAILPAFLSSLGVAAAWLGIIEGVSDGLSSFAKLGSGFYTDRLPRRKPIAFFGYLVTALATGAFGLATTAWHVLIARAVAWLGRGVRTPVRKALLAAAVEPSVYGRAFGFERAMDTLGAIVGPLTALGLLAALPGNYRTVFAIAILPGLVAAALIAIVVQERVRAPVPHASFGERLTQLPSAYRRLLLAVGIFGAGAFAHTLLILLATQRLTPSLGVSGAATAAVALYVLHNVFYAGFSYLGGLLADRFPKNRLLACGYALAALMALGIIFLPVGLGPLALVFILGGIQVAIEETLEDAFCAELVEPAQHGMAFGILATVNGIGDFLSSAIVGLLWSAVGQTAAFGYSAVLFLLGAVLTWQVRAPMSSSGSHPGEF